MAKPSFEAKIVNEKEIKDLFNVDFPDYVRFSAANTASRVVFLGLEKSEDTMRREFLLRNKYVVSNRPGRGALKFERAIPHRDIDKITASWGAPDRIGQRDYNFLEEQETGFSHSGPVPAERARISAAQKKRIRRINYLARMQVRDPRDFGQVNSNDRLARTWAMLREAYREGYGRPGSDQFFYMDKRELPNGMVSGWFQFRTTTPESGDSFPQWQQIYYNRDNQRRKAKRWMEQSKDQITQGDIDKIYADEFNKSFTRNIKRNW